jgi:hypothetical protein
MTRNQNQSDPGVLEILGAIAEILGLADHIQQLLPLDTWRVEKHHRQKSKLLQEFDERIADARAALRVVSSAIEQYLSNAPPDTIRFSIPASELSVLQRGLEQLHAAIREMTRVVFKLEAITAGIADEQQRFYRISETGRVVLDTLRKAMNGDAQAVPPLLRDVDRFLANCSGINAERNEWRDEPDVTSQKRRRTDSEMPNQAYRPWTDAEDQELCKGFDSELSITALAEKHKRSEGAIRSRLQRLGKVHHR